MKHPKLLRLSAAAAAATLLCGYTLNGTGLITWTYFGTPLVTHPYNPGTGAPTMVEYSRALPSALAALPINLLDKIRFTLPEGRDIRLNPQGLVPDSDDKTNVRFKEDAEVWVTFVSEGAGYRNSIGYFTYDPANPPTSPSQVQDKIIFVNASMPTPLDASGLQHQNTIKLGAFKAGQALGFVIVSDGFSPTGRLYNGSRIGGVKDNARPTWIFYTLRQLNPEAASPQNLNVHTLVLKDVADSSDGYQRLVIGFEDINRESGGDHDFNDVVLAIHVTPGRAIANLQTLQPLAAANDRDSDGDGVKDGLDEFPNDATRAFSRYYPGADIWGTLAFEDQWPQSGDYDLNDVVVRYRSREVMNAARQVVALEMDYSLQARGGLLDSGFGVHLPGILATRVASATLATGAAPAQTMAVESGQTDASFVIFNSSHAHMPVSTDTKCPFGNTQAACPSVAPVPFRLVVNFNQPLASTLFAAPYNPFIYRRSRRGQEVHLPGKPATRLADTSLFGSGNDKTVAGTATTYMDAQRRPWALDIPTPWAWPLEATDLLRPYPRFAQWATSSGTVARDWYINGVTTQHLFSRP
jgi:LruC domain-containing protein